MEVARIARQLRAAVAVQSHARAGRAHTRRDSLGDVQLAAVPRTLVPEELADEGVDERHLEVVPTEAVHAVAHGQALARRGTGE
jgi:hypothetical protein